MNLKVVLIVSKHRSSDSRHAARAFVPRPHALMIAISALAAVPFAQAQSEPPAGLEQVIVTGTRSQGTKETASISPIAVITGDALTKTGQNSLIDALLRLEPTFATAAKGGDVANMVRSATLRTLTANETLVLVNGKRRNTTAYINPGNGNSAVDLDLIPISSIARVEVLKDGAAAQYGSDAIAGVINIILKSGTDGTVQVDYGQFADSKVNPNNLGHGRTRSVAADKGFKLGEDGFIHLSGEIRDKLHTNQTGPELRQATSGSGVPLYQSAYPFNRSVPNTLGDASYKLYSGGYNAGFKLNPDLELYSFGTFSKRDAESLQNNRPVEVARASDCFVVPGTATTVRTNIPGTTLGTNCTTRDVSALAAKYYPAGFFIPIETLKEKNLALAFGAKGTVWDDMRWDASLSYGSNKMDIGVEQSLNYAYLMTAVTPTAGAPTGSSQTSAYIGGYKNSQTLFNFDLSKPFNVGLPEPLDVSVGVEARRDTYKITAGDTQSWSNGGLQGFIGETPTDAGSYSRTEQAAYVELDTNLTKEWTVSAAGRFEHFSDSGNTTTGKLSSRYDFNPMVGIRGTYSTGFRAPNLAEQYFTTTTVGPTSATVVLPPGSPSAALLGGQALKPEKSKSLSFGLVFTPTRATRFTIDAYQIKITDKLVSTSYNAGLDAPIGGTTGLVYQAINARGVVLPATASGSGVGVQFFGNGVDTTVQGLDMTAATTTEMGPYGQIRWTLSGNFNNTKIDKMPASYLPNVASGLTDSQPKDKFVLQADYLIDKWTLTSRVTHYGAVSSLSVPTSTSYNAVTNPYIRTVNRAAFILDGELGYQLTPDLKLVLGGNNLTNRRPTTPPSQLVSGSTNPLLTAAQRSTSQINSTGANLVSTLSPYGINGAYYYARAIYKF